MFCRRAALSVLATCAVLVACSDEPAKEAKTPSPSPTSATATLPTAISAAGADQVPLASREVQRISLDSPDRLVDAFGSIWVKRDDGSVERVDPDRGRVVASVPWARYGGYVCQGLGATDAAVWFCPAEGKLARIDPRTNKRTVFKVDHISDQLQYVEASSRIWLIAGTGDAVIGMADDGTLSDPIPLGGQCSELAAVHDTIWAACPADGRLVRVDVAERKVTGEVSALPGAHRIAAAGSVWAGFDGGLAQVDPEALEVTAVYETGPGLGGAVWADDDEVWVRAEGSPFLTHIDPVAGTVLATVTAPGLSSGGDVLKHGDDVWTTASDDATLVRLRAG